MPHQNRVAVTGDFESYYIPKMIKENKGEKLLSVDLKQDDDKSDLEVILANLIDNYLEVLQEWIPKIVGLEEEKQSSADMNYSDRMNNLGCCNENEIRKNKKLAEVENVEMYNCDCHNCEIIFEKRIELIRKNGFRIRNSEPVESDEKEDDDETIVRDMVLEVRARFNQKDSKALKIVEKVTETDHVDEISFLTSILFSNTLINYQESAGIDDYRVKGVCKKSEEFNQRMGEKCELRDSIYLTAPHSDQGHGIKYNLSHLLHLSDLLDLCDLSVISDLLDISDFLDLCDLLDITDLLDLLHK
ncbi:25314_t:CDS:2 [Gigaspora margarita]|uniref:25314_t:CDS:1 n=1 Tax=Gigaspora margarita TaxID=4874 RepID=A0ABN7VCT5_GIGMA|nr:25314_t:CDS:2 [Gigaspora margarita]